MTDSTVKKDSAPRTKLEQRWGALKDERASWFGHWADISRYLLPRNGRFFVQDRNKGWSRTNSIYDSTGTGALRILAAGMMSGMTSPARPWFKLAVPSNNPAAKSPAVKKWLNDATIAMRNIFARSNCYRALHSIYEELAAFGTSACIVASDPDMVLRFFPLTAGEYAIATNMKGEVVTLYREFQKSVGELVKEFGYDQCCPSTQSMYDNGSLDQWVSVIHAIEPRADRDRTKIDNTQMPWSSVYFELGGDPDKVLRESGFKMFRALVPRWSLAGGDIYGGSPSMDCLGDVKGLQQKQLRKAQAIDYMTKPPLQMPTSMKGQDVETLPGGIAYVDSASPSGGIRSQFEVRLDLSHLLADIQDSRQLIRGTYYADLFLMLANDGGSGRMTATEVAERHEEKLLMLGPVLERLQNELLDPLISITFQEMIDKRMIGPPPPELAKQPLVVQYVSMLAQAQQAVGVNSIDRFTGQLGVMSQVKPQVLDKFDVDHWADTYADILGVDPELVVSDKDVAIVRANRAKAQAAAQQAAQVPAMAAAAKNASGVDPQGLHDVISNFSGYTTPQGT